MLRRRLAELAKLVSGGSIETGKDGEDISLYGCNARHRDQEVWLTVTQQCIIVSDATTHMRYDLISLCDIDTILESTSEVGIIRPNSYDVLLQLPDASTKDHLLAYVLLAKMSEASPLALNLVALDDVSKYVRLSCDDPPVFIPLLHTPYDFRDLAYNPSVKAKLFQHGERCIQFTDRVFEAPRNRPPPSKATKVVIVSDGSVYVTDRVGNVETRSVIDKVISVTVYCDDPQLVVIIDGVHRVVAFRTKYRTELLESLRDVKEDLLVLKEDHRPAEYSVAEDEKRSASGSSTAPAPPPPDEPEQDSLAKHTAACSVQSEPLPPPPPPTPPDAGRHLRYEEASLPQPPSPSTLRARAGHLTSPTPSPYCAFDRACLPIPASPADPVLSSTSPRVASSRITSPSRPISERGRQAVALANALTTSPYRTPLSPPQPPPSADLLAENKPPSARGSASGSSSASSNLRLSSRSASPQKPPPTAPIDTPPARMPVEPPSLQVRAERATLEHVCNLLQKQLEAKDEELATVSHRMQSLSEANNALRHALRQTSVAPDDDDDSGRTDGDLSHLLALREAELADTKLRLEAMQAVTEAGTPTNSKKPKPKVTRKLRPEEVDTQRSLQAKTRLAEAAVRYIRSLEKKVERLEQRNWQDIDDACIPPHSEDELRKQLAIREHQLQEAKRHQQALEKDITRLRSDRDKHRAQADRVAEEVVQRAKTKAEDLAFEVYTSKSQLGEATEKMKQLQATLAKHEEETHRKLAEKDAKLCQREADLRAMYEERLAKAEERTQAYERKLARQQAQLLQELHHRETESQQLSKALLELRANATTMSPEVREVLSQMGSAKSEVADLKQKLKYETARAKHLEAQLRVAKVQIEATSPPPRGWESRAEDVVAGKDRIIRQLEEELEALRSTPICIDSSHQDTYAEVRRLNDINRQLTQQVDELSGEVQLARKEEKECKGALSRVNDDHKRALEEAMSACTAEKEKALEALAKAEAKIKSMEVALSLAEIPHWLGASRATVDTVDEHKEEVLALKAELVQAQEALEAEVAKQRTYCRTIKGHSKQLSDLRHDLEAKCAQKCKQLEKDLRAKLQEVEQEVSEAKSREAKMKARIAELRSQVEQAKNQVGSLKEARQTAERALKEREGEIEAIRGQESAEIADLAGVVRRYKATIQKLEEQLELKEATLRALSKSGEDTAASEARIEQLEHQLLKATQQFQQLEEHVAMEREAFEQLDPAGLRRMVDEKDAALKESHEAIGKLQDEVTALQNKLHRVQAEREVAERQYQQDISESIERAVVEMTTRQRARSSSGGSSNLLPPQHTETEPYISPMRSLTSQQDPACDRLASVSPQPDLNNTDAVLARIQQVDCNLRKSGLPASQINKCVDQLRLALRPSASRSPHADEDDHLLDGRSVTPQHTRPPPTTSQRRKRSQTPTAAGYASKFRTRRGQSEELADPLPSVRSQHETDHRSQHETDHPWQPDPRGPRLPEPSIASQLLAARSNPPTGSDPPRLKCSQQTAALYEKLGLSSLAAYAAT